MHVRQQRHLSPVLVTLLSMILLITSLPTVRAFGWMTPGELMKDLTVYQSMVAALVGIQLWESIISFPFEWRYFTRKRVWKHGMTAYLIIRYGTWIHLVTVLVNIHTTDKIDCEATMIVLLISLSLATLATSLIFVVRCIAVWKRNRFVTVGLAALWVATAAVHLSSPVRLKSIWSPAGCQSYFTRPMWEYNMAYVMIQVLDTITFGLSAWRLRTMRTHGFAKVLFAQSCVFIGITATLNLACMTLVYLSLNPVMTYILSPIALTISGILACRCFRDLQLHAQRSATVSTGVSAPAWDANGSAAPRSTGGSSLQPPPVTKDVVMELNAIKGRGLGRRRKEDWLTRSGLAEDEPTGLPMPASASAPIRHHSTSSHLPCASASRTQDSPCQSRDGIKSDLRPTSTSFHGFLLPEEEEEHQRDELAIRDAPTWQPQPSIIPHASASEARVTTTTSQDKEQTVRPRSRSVLKRIDTSQSCPENAWVIEFQNHNGIAKTTRSEEPSKCPLPRTAARRAQIDDGSPNKGHKRGYPPHAINEEAHASSLLLTKSTSKLSSTPSSSSQACRNSHRCQSQRSSRTSGYSEGGHSIALPDGVTRGGEKCTEAFKVGVTCHSEARVDT